METSVEILKETSRPLPRALEANRGLSFLNPLSSFNQVGTVDKNDFP